MATKSPTKQNPASEEPKADSQEPALSRKKLIEFARLDIKKDDLTRELKEALEKHRKMQDEILRAFEQLGTESVKFAGHSIYTFKQLWAKPQEGIERIEVIKALKKHGFKDYVAENFNTQSLSARLRELEKQYFEMHMQKKKEGRKPFRLADYLPKPLVKVLKLEPDYSIRIQGTIPTEVLDKLEEEVNDDGNKP